MHKSVFLFFIFILAISRNTCQASDSTQVNKKRLYPVLIGINGAYIGSMIYVSSVWYKEKKSSFHFFNDLPQWKQMDKAGHFTTAFIESQVVTKSLLWSGVSPKKSYIYGTLAGFLYQAPIEFLDGYEPEYGASVSDLAANALGAGFPLVQYILWEETRVKPKFSFHTTQYAQLRPNVLGENLGEQMLKDYNGQTYWLAFNIHRFAQEQKIPKWLNISLGYSANGMVYSREIQNNQAGYKAYRQYFLSLDIDFEHVPLKSKLLKTLLYPLNFIHIPFPALEFSNNSFKLHPIYF
jgi:hypothetical protein